jgi:hypothetical protein
MFCIQATNYLQELMSDTDIEETLKTETDDINDKEKKIKTG